MRSLLALRQVLEVGCRALVLPEQVCIPQAEHAFDESGNLSNADAAGEACGSWSVGCSIRRTDPVRRE